MTAELGSAEGPSTTGAPAPAGSTSCSGAIGGTAAGEGPQGAVRLRVADQDATEQFAAAADDQLLVRARA